jgi:hypothetical protein
MWENPDDAPNPAHFQVPEVPGGPSLSSLRSRIESRAGSRAQARACTGAVADSRAAKSDEVEGQQRFDLAA